MLVKTWVGDYMRPVIGLIPLFDDDKESYWMLPGYMKVLEKCGALPIMLPLTNDEEELDSLYEIVDGLLLTGGHDVGPDVYGEIAKATCGIPCKQRDKMEAYLLTKTLNNNKPVFGICRGIQFMNAHLGGTLYQDLPTEFPTDVEHHMEKPYDIPIHKVEIVKDTKLADIIGSGEYPVNSYHHQAIKDLAKGVTVMAISEDGLVEAIGVDGVDFAMAVQWHPEFSYEKDEKSVQLIQAFVNACK